MPSTDVLHTSHGDVALPAFFPDATRGVVRSLDAADLEACGIPGLVVNAFHLGQRPGSRCVHALGGVHKLMGWQRPVISDSGGFQIFSLIRQNPKLGSITSKEAIFRAADGQKTQCLSPEKSIQIQLRLGADVLVCLDDCTHPAAPRSEQTAAVVRTIEWAERCKAEFERGLRQRGPKRDASTSLGMTTGRGANAASLPSPLGRGEGEGASPLRSGPPESKAPSPQPSPQGRGGVALPRPLLFAVIQGGADADLRRLCAKELTAIGFDGYGFGGWPFDSHGRLLSDILALTADLMPADKPRYALGIGSPAALVACAKMGYNLFDCALPTRDARRGRLHIFRSDGLEHGRLYIRDDAHRRDGGPISDACDCLCCRSYSRAYLHHLFAVGDALAWRLATIHNLRFYTALLERVRREDSSRMARMDE